MGQYYDVYALSGGIEKHYNRYVLPECEYMMAKLTEHSWWENPFCRALAWSIVDTPTRIAWVGDYANDAENFDDFKDVVVKINGIYNEETDEYEGNLKKEPISPAPENFRLEDYFLVNETKKCYVSLAEYFEMNVHDGWCFFPISLLTAIGNGLGGGDYRGINMSDIGSWTMDSIYLTKDVPNLGFVKESYSFKEGGLL